MIAAQSRFHGNNSLNYVYRKGMTLRSKYFAVKYAHNDRRESYRVAVVISRKVSKSSVIRNRIRRRLYELVRTELAERLKNVDIVITVFDAELAVMPADELKRSFLRVFGGMR